jgi:hypothetical protein
VVLKEDITRVLPEEIKDVPIGLTLMGGEIRFSDWKSH